MDARDALRKRNIQDFKEGEMDNRIHRGKESTLSSTDEYRASVKNLIQTEVGSIIDEEIRLAARELVEEQRKAIREAVEEHKLIIRQVVEEEKRKMRTKIDDLQRSIIKLGIG
jgi:hypothetical protein